MAIIDGKLLAQNIKDSLKQELEVIKKKTNKSPKLTVILVGDFAPSKIYVKNKEKSATEIGIQSEVIRLPQEVSEQELLKKIETLNTDQSVNGILVQYLYLNKLTKKKLLMLLILVKTLMVFTLTMLVAFLQTLVALYHARLLAAFTLYNLLKKTYAA